MAFIRVNPVEVRVRTDWFSGRPREITWGDERLPVLRLQAVRAGGRCVPRDHRSEDAVRGRHAREPVCLSRSSTVHVAGR